MPGASAPGMPEKRSKPGNAKTHATQKRCAVIRRRRLQFGAGDCKKKNSARPRRFWPSCVVSPGAPTRNGEKLEAAGFLKESRGPPDARFSAIAWMAPVGGKEDEGFRSLLNDPTRECGHWRFCISIWRPTSIFPISTRAERVFSQRVWENGPAIPAFGGVRSGRGLGC